MDVDDDMLNKFIEKHTHLLDVEHESECEEFRQIDLGKHSRVLERDGLLIKPSKIAEIATEFGKLTVVFQRQKRVKVEFSHSPISAGDPVDVWVDGESIKEFCTPGIVTNISEKLVSVSFNQMSSFGNLESCSFTIVKAASDATTRRMKDALKYIKNLKFSGSSAIVGILFGSTELVTIPLPPKITDANGEIKYFNNQLHEGQKKAVKFALEQKNFAVVHGPPGTGKTTTLVEIVLQLVAAGNKILLCAPSNIAVDTILEKLLVYNAKIVRLGHPARMLDSIKCHSLNAAVSNGSNAEVLSDVKRELAEIEKQMKSSSCGKKELRKEMKDLKKELHSRERNAQRESLMGADVVLTTLTSASNGSPLKYLPDDHFGVVVIDECSQGLEAACWIVLPRAAKVILAGDHRQLPPTIKSKEAAERGLGVTLMERAIRKIGEPCYHLLTNQFRMNSDIMAWVSKTMYENKLTADESVANHLLKDIDGVKDIEETGTSLLFINTAGCDVEETDHDEKGSVANEGEANIVAQLVKKLIDAGLKADSMSVITPYSLQVLRIKENLLDEPDVEVRTVDGFQGREKEAIILSFVRSNERGEIGFVTDKRRLNVAVSRARRLLVVVGDSLTLGHDAHIASLLDHMEQFGIVHFAGDYLEGLNYHAPTPKKPITKINKKSSQPKKKEGKANNSCTKAIPSTSKNTSKPGQVNIWIKKLEDFFKNPNVTSYECPKNLSGYDRSLVHEAAEFLGFNHCSKNVGEHRQLVVSRCEAAQNRDVRELNACSTVPEHTKIYNQKEKPEMESKSSSVKVQGKGKTACKVKSKAESGKTRKEGSKGDNDSEDDFDTLIASFQKSDYTCSMLGCSASCKLLGQRCIHCKEMFCLSHGLPEIHGCGEAACKMARQNFRHPEPKQMKEKEKDIASSRLHKKITNLSESRKMKTKESK